MYKLGQNEVQRKYAFRNTHATYWKSFTVLVRIGREGSGGMGAFSSWGSVSIEIRCFCLTSRQIGGRSLTCKKK